MPDQQLCVLSGFSQNTLKFSLKKKRNHQWENEIVLLFYIWVLVHNSKFQSVCSDRLQENVGYVRKQ